MRAALALRRPLGDAHRNLSPAAPLIRAQFVLGLIELDPIYTLQPAVAQVMLLYDESASVSEVRYDVPVTTQELLASSVRLTVFPESALLIAPVSEDMVPELSTLSFSDAVLMSSTITSPVRVTPLAVKVTLPPSAPEVPHVPGFSAAAVSNVPYESLVVDVSFVTVTSVRVIDAVVLAIANTVAGLFCPLDVEPSAHVVLDEVTGQLYLIDPLVIVKLEVPVAASPDVLW